MNRFIPIAITLLLVVIVVRWLGLGTILRNLSSIGWKGVGWISVLYGISQIIRTLRFRIALKSAKDITFGKMFGIVSIHQFLNHVLPARIGEMSFPLMIKKLKGTPIVQTTSVLMLIRAQEIILLGAFFITALLLHGGVENKIGSGKIAQNVVVGASSLFVLSLFAFFLIPSFIKLSIRIVRYSAIIGAKIPAIGLFLNKGAEILDDLQVAFRQNRLSTLNLQCMFLTILMWLTMFILFHMIMLMSGVEISFSQSVIGSSIATVIQLLPVNVFGSFGSLQAGWTIGFVMMGVDAKTALMTGLILHLIVIAILAMTACPAWLILFRVER